MFLVLFAGALLGSGNLFAANQIKDSDCLDCHSDKSLTKTDPAGREVSLFVDKARLAASVHASNTCASCHSDISGKHPDDNRPAQPINCGSCHDQAAKDWSASVHGKAAAAGLPDAPGCIDCHGGHGIETLKQNSPLKISEQVCSRCHASERINTKYNLPPDRAKTFFESYHGLAAQLGSPVVANCGSCHGYHKILPSSDPDSTIHSSHLVQTCGKCHPGATENFALSKIHVDAASDASGSGGDGVGGRINWWVRRIYLLLIFATIGSMLIHNGLLFYKKVAAHLRASGRPVVRMSLVQRWQHAVLAVSFIALAVTGFALKFPDSWLARALGSNEPLRRWAHRVAGIVLLLAGAYHIVYLLASKDGRRLVKDLFPIKKDLADVWAAVRYLTGLSKIKPRIGRFGYAEKMEYWAVVWGTIIMGVTGLMVWFKMDVTRFVPRWAVDVALTIHYYEAVLACLAIVVWHFYHVIFDPDVYPLNLACWDGKVSEHWQQEEHPLEPAENTRESTPTREINTATPVSLHDDR